MTTKLIGFCASAAVAVYVVLCGLAYALGDSRVYVNGVFSHKTKAVFTFWHPGFLAFVGAVLCMVLFDAYEPAELTKDERDVLKRYRDSL